MFFRRNEGQYRETDRVTRFKLIKSGKHWLRAATANFGLFKVFKGTVDVPSMHSQNIEERTPIISGEAFLKGLITTGTVLGGAVATYQFKPRKQVLQLWKAKQLQIMMFWQILNQ